MWLQGATRSSSSAGFRRSGLRSSRNGQTAPGKNTFVAVTLDGHIDVGRRGSAGVRVIVGNAKDSRASSIVEAREGRWLI